MIKSNCTAISLSLGKCTALYTENAHMSGVASLHLGEKKKQRLETKFNVQKFHNNTVEVTNQLLSH